MNWHTVGLIYCLSGALVCLCFVVSGLLQDRRYKQTRIHRGPFKDYKRNNVESVP